jgi:hypothetical protein
LNQVDHKDKLFPVIFLTLSLQDAVYVPNTHRVPSLRPSQPYGPYPQRNHSPYRGPARGVINSSDVLLDPSRVFGISPPKQQPFPMRDSIRSSSSYISEMYSTGPQNSTTRRSISAPDPRRSWPAGGVAWAPQGPIISRLATGQNAVPQARRRGACCFTGTNHEEITLNL